MDPSGIIVQCQVLGDDWPFLVDNRVHTFETSLMQLTSAPEESTRLPAKRDASRRSLARTGAKPYFISGGGEAGLMMSALDWGATALGKPDGWAQPLKTLVDVLLASGQSMSII